MNISRRYMTSFSYIKDIQDPDPRGWNIDNREFTIYNHKDEDPDDNEIPHPYQDEFEEDDLEDNDSDVEYLDEITSASEDESDASSVQSVPTTRRRKNFTVILQEEDFDPE